MPRVALGACKAFQFHTKWRSKKKHFFHFYLSSQISENHFSLHSPYLQSVRLEWYDSRASHTHGALRHSHHTCGSRIGGTTFQHLAETMGIWDVRSLWRLPCLCLLPCNVLGREFSHCGRTMDRSEWCLFYCYDRSDVQNRNRDQCRGSNRKLFQLSDGKK